MSEQENETPWERCLFVGVCIAALLLLATLARPLLTGRIPVVLDLGYFHLPLRDWYAQCLAQGWQFDWLPQMYNGLFMTGEGEHGPYHPLHLLCYRLLPLDRAFALEAFLPFPLMLLGMFLFLRRHAGRSAALLGGLIYTFSGNNLCHGCHVNYVGILAHLPWLLGSIDEATSGATLLRRRLSLLGIAVLTGSQLLLGQPQAMSYSLLTEIVYCGFVLQSWRRLWRMGLPLLSAKLLGALLGAVQLLATWEFLGNSSRTGINAALGGLPFALLAQLLSPALLRLPLEGWFYEAFYLGMAPIALCLCWRGCRLSTLDSRPTARLAWFAVVLGILAVWLATGVQGGLYSLQLTLPIVKHFRCPGRYINLLGFAAALLSALVFDRLQQCVRTGQILPWRRLGLPWLGVGATLVVALLFHRAYPQQNQLSLSRSFYSGFLLMSAAALALTLAGRGWAIGLFALVTLTALEIDYFCLRGPNVGEPLWRYAPTLAQWQSNVPRPPTAQAGRVLSRNMPALCLLHHGERLVNGYLGGIEPRKTLDYLRAAPLRLSGAAWYSVHDRRLLDHSPELSPADENWHAVPAPLPRFRLLGRTRVSADPAADLQHLDIDTTALVTHPLAVERGEAGSVRLLHEEPSELWLSAEVSGRRLLVIADSYDPGWQVEVDGEARIVEQVNGDFLGCVLEPGKHEVRFAFRPWSIYYGRRLSLLGLALTLMIAAAILTAAWLERKKALRAWGQTAVDRSPRNSSLAA